jgi:3-deoxy-D-manno-octulosonic-acid transferase
MFRIYNLLLFLILLISPFIIIYRLIIKKEDFNRFKEKFCLFSYKQPKNKKVVWFHGSSVGEINSIIPLIEKLEKKNYIDIILVTSSTLSSSKVLSKFKFDKVVHQFFPIDTKYFSKKFLDYWNPKAVFFIESEIWPNMITNIKKREIPLILLNSRITKKTFKRWRKFPNLSRSIFNKFDLCLPQNKQTKIFLKLLGCKKIKKIGNIKFSEIQKAPTIKFNSGIKKFFNSKKIWCASSTHKGEEILCGITHQKMSKIYNNLLTIIIPRHVNRTVEIKRCLENNGLKVHIHSNKEKIDKKTDIYLVDTYGETQSFFNICKTIFLGGSIVKHGGQNPLEPARFGCKIIHGPNIDNFKEVYELLKHKKISFQINSINQLYVEVKKLLKQKSNNVKKVLNLRRYGVKILNETLLEINKFIQN